MNSLQKTIPFVLLLSLILITGCSVSEQGIEQIEDENSSLITGNVVALVNGEEITSDEVALVQQSYAQQGYQLSDDEAIEQLVNLRILSQESKKEGFTVSTEEAESFLTSQLQAQGATLDDYKNQLISLGQSYEEQLEYIKEDIIIQNYVGSLFEDDLIEVSEEEARSFYNDYKEQSVEEIPSFEELKDDVIFAIEQQKQQQMIDALIEDLKLTADIVYS